MKGMKKTAKKVVRISKPKPAPKKKRAAEDFSQAAFRIVREATERD